MTLMRWDPFRDLVNIQGRLNRLIADSASPTAQYEEGYGAWIPPVDIFERGDNLVIRVEVPGVRTDDIDVRLENGTLILRGERKNDVDVEERTAYRMERSFGPFTRSFSLPTTVDASKISGGYKDGVLELTIPKAEEAKPRKIRIDAA